MADTENKTPAENTKTEDKKSNTTPTGSKLMPIIIIAVVVIVCLGGGFVIGHILLSSPASAAAASTTETSHAEKSKEKGEGKEKGKEKEKGKGHGKAESKGEEKSVSDGVTPWSFEIEPVIANLDEPGVTRYVRVTIILEMNSEFDQEKGTAMLEEKKALLRDWLTIYLAGCTIEEARGSKNLVRIKAEVRDAFNDYLFKNSKPMVESILFKEFAIQ
ncbi:MAG: flagellar basal body-associated FliL family protein [Sedimentisphaerales bacterium]|nr:flagellar basal body-associated FliL family protein [Sedimentisphaerales bacterium]